MIAGQIQYWLLSEPIDGVEVDNMMTISHICRFAIDSMVLKHVHNKTMFKLGLTLPGDISPEPRSILTVLQRILILANPIVSFCYLCLL